MLTTTEPGDLITDYAHEVTHVYLNAPKSSLTVRDQVLAASKQVLATKPTGFASDFMVESAILPDLGYAFDPAELKTLLAKDYPDGANPAEYLATTLHARILAIIAIDYVPEAAPENAFAGFKAR
jgi:hypothetical protein